MDPETVFTPMKDLWDTIYLDTKEPEQPFFICSIFAFNLKKRDTLSLVVKWFFRVSELPISVRDHLLQDRHNEHGPIRQTAALSALSAGAENDGGHIGEGCTVFLG
ncbi:hypothetical protein ACOMHN_025273 [Nucella lapillus]